MLGGKRQEPEHWPFCRNNDLSNCQRCLLTIVHSSRDKEAFTDSRQCNKQEGLPRLHRFISDESFQAYITSKAKRFLPFWKTNVRFGPHQPASRNSSWQTAIRQRLPRQELRDFTQNKAYITPSYISDGKHIQTTHWNTERIPGNSISAQKLGLALELTW